MLNKDMKYKDIMTEAEKELEENLSTAHKSNKKQKAKLKMGNRAESFKDSLNTNKEV